MKTILVLAALVLVAIGTLSCSTGEEWEMEGTAVDYRVVNSEEGTLYFDNGKVITINRNWTDESIILLNQEGMWYFRDHGHPFGTVVDEVEYAEDIQ